MLKIKEMFQQWEQGQEIFDIVNRIDLFIEMASKNTSRSPQEIKNYLEAQPWFKHTLDNK